MIATNKNHLEPPCSQNNLFMAWIPLDVGKISLRFLSILTWLLHAVPTDFVLWPSSYATSQKGVLLDPVSGKLLTNTELIVMILHDATLKPFLLCDMLHYHARTSLEILAMKGCTFSATNKCWHHIFPHSKGWYYLWWMI